MLSWLPAELLLLSLLLLLLALQKFALLTVLQPEAPYHKVLLVPGHPQSSRSVHEAWVVCSFQKKKKKKSFTTLLKSSQYLGK